MPVVLFLQNVIFIQALLAQKTKSMKVSQNKASFQRYAMILLTCFLSTALWAQDGNADVKVKLGNDDPTWYKKPWVWIIGGAVFLLLLVALLKGDEDKD